MDSQAEPDLLEAGTDAKHLEDCWTELVSNWNPVVSPKHGVVVLSTTPHHTKDRLGGGGGGRGRGA